MTYSDRVVAVKPLAPMPFKRALIAFLFTVICFQQAVAQGRETFDSLYRSWQEIEDPEQRIALGERALRLAEAMASSSPDQFRERVKGHLLLGIADAYRVRMQGDRDNNLEKATVAYEAAVRILTREAYPYEWSIATYNLGRVYAARVRGDRASNERTARDLLLAALAIQKAEGFDQERVETTLFLKRLFDNPSFSPTYPRPDVACYEGADGTRLCRSSPTGEEEKRMVIPKGDVLPYVPVKVFFGTNRIREGDRAKGNRQLATFGSGQSTMMALGHAIVTVPLSGRDKGVIPRPSEGVFGLNAEIENAAFHFALFDVQVTTVDQFIVDAKHKLDAAKTFKGQAFVFVHGFNVPFDDALFRTAQIAHDLEFDGIPFVYSWPSKGGIFGWKRDHDAALGARALLGEFLELVARQSGSTQIHLIAHSMGNWPLLEVLSTVTDLRFNQIVLAAPDMDRANFEIAAAKIRPLAKNLTLYASSRDWAMKVSGVLSLGEDRVGYVPKSGVPAIVPGVETIDVSQVSLNFFSLNHGEFAEHRHLLHDLGLMLRHGTSPPDKRLPLIYEPIPRPEGIYWKYRR